MRASKEYDLALSYLEANDFVYAAKHVNIMAHYIIDLAVFGQRDELEYDVDDWTPPLRLQELRENQEQQL